MPMISIHRFLLLVLTAAVVLAGCATRKRETAPAAVKEPAEVPKPELPNPQQVVLYYQRTPCFGMCPSFELVVYQSGKAVYEGKNLVDNIGFYQSTVPDTAFQKVLEVAQRIEYFRMQEKYDKEGVTDLPTVTTRIFFDGKLKTVANRYQGPRELQQLYQALDDLVFTLKWEPVRHENNH
jgi:hypothetical protein